MLRRLSYSFPLAGCCVEDQSAAHLASMVLPGTPCRLAEMRWLVHTRRNSRCFGEEFDISRECLHQIENMEWKFKPPILSIGISRALPARCKLPKIGGVWDNWPPKADMCATPAFVKFLPNCCTGTELLEIFQQRTHRLHCDYEFWR